MKVFSLDTSRFYRLSQLKPL